MKQRGFSAYIYALTGSLLPFGGCLWVAGVTAPAAQAQVLEEIVVTARKRDETINEIADTIQVFSEQVIEDAGVQRVNDLQQFATNFSLVEAQQPGVVLINIRGIGQVRNGEAPIAMVVDGVQSNVANQITQALFDVKQIEVLKGPQGSLYGRNAIGGAINVTTRAPSENFQGYVTAGYAEGEDWRGEFGFGGPVEGTEIRYRLAGYASDRDGQIDNITLNDEIDFDESWGLRGTLEVPVSENLSVTLRSTYLDQEAGAAFYVPIAVTESNSEPKPVIANRKGYGKREIEEFSLKADWHSTKVNATWILSYSGLYSFLDEDLDWLPLDLLSATQELDNDAWSTEIRFLSPDDESKLSWSAGLYYLKVERDLETIIFARPDLTGLPAPLPQPPTSARDDNDSYAVFARVDYDFTEKLNLALGLRYDIEDREQQDLTTRETFSETFTSLQPKLSGTYDFSDTLTGFFSAGKGFRSGGFNSNSAVSRQYDSEELWNYETGLRIAGASGKFNINLTAFYTDITDRQVYGLDLTIAPLQFIANPIEEAHIFGAEAEIRLQPIERLQLALGVGLLDTEIDKYDTSVLSGTLANGDFKGNELNQTPSYSITAAAQYSVPVSSRFTLTGRIDISRSGGDYYWEIDNRDKRDSRILVNARLKLVYAERFEIEFFAENLFDEDYNEEFVPVEWSAAVSGDIGLPGRPRQIGILSTVRF